MDKKCKDDQSECIIYALIQSEIVTQATLPVVGDNSLFKNIDLQFTFVQTWCWLSPNVRHQWPLVSGDNKRSNVTWRMLFTRCLDLCGDQWEGRTEARWPIRIQYFETLQCTGPSIMMGVMGLKRALNTSVARVDIIMVTDQLRVFNDPLH